MTDRLFLPVGGTGGGPTDTTFDKILWKKIIDLNQNSGDRARIGFLTTPSRLCGINPDDLLTHHKKLENIFNCGMILLDDEAFSLGEYDDKIDVLCITCGDTKGALDLWKENKSDDVICRLYESGIVITGYSAGFVSFYEWASTDSVPGPDGSQFGAIPCLGIIKGGAVPHIDTQQSRISDFQKFLQSNPISPVLGLGENVMAIYRNENFEEVVKTSSVSLAGWVKEKDFVQI